MLQPRQGEHEIVIQAEGTTGARSVLGLTHVDDTLCQMRLTFGGGGR
jgi:hypothetical protein